MEIQLTTGDPALALELIQTQQVDLAIAGKPNNLPSSVAFHKIDDISLSLIAPSVAGHEGIVPMVGLGFGLAMLPDVVIDNSPMNNQISRLNLDKPIEPFELVICTQKRNLEQPLIRAFWAMLE